MSKHKMLYRDDLQTETTDFECDCGCGCTETEGIYFHSTCHPESPTWVMYDGEIGGLIVECAECGGEIVRVAVAYKKAN